MTLGRLSVVALALIALALLVLAWLPRSAARLVKPDEPKTELSAVAQLGRRIFFDKSLSASGQQSCATCHSPAHAYGPPNGMSVQPGGPDMQGQGSRAVPSLRYLEHNPSFSIGPTGSIPDDDAPAGPPQPPGGASPAGVEANDPQGGLDWDGRVDTFQDQARGPFLDANEMANRSAAELLEKLQKTNYADGFRKLFGAAVFDQPELALSEALFALSRFQLEDPSFHPYDSKYDFYLAGKVALTKGEMRGLKLFEDPKKGNCAACHIHKASRDGVFRPVFTDYQFVALGVPRNPEIRANRNPAYYDLGLCGPLRKDYIKVGAYCGLFKTPTLRNVATRSVFFHNGVFKSLDEVLRFYVERDTNPEKWYPKRPGGTAEKFDDLPAVYRRNVDVIDGPFDRKRGEQSALNDGEIADIVEFLKTLNDGWRR